MYFKCTFWLKCTIVIMCCPSVVVNFSHFRLLLWNHWTEFNETWQESRSQLSQRPLQSFSGRLEKQDGRPGLWLAETFSTSPLKPLNGIQENLAGSKISTFSTEFVFCGPIRKTRWLPWPLIGWDIFDFSSVTAERNSTKLDRKQDLNVLYQVCVFRENREKKIAALASDWLRHFRLLHWNHWTEFQWNLTGSKISTFSTKFVFFGWIWKTRWLPFCLLWNRWTAFNETWQKAICQHPLRSLCFSGQLDKQDGRPNLWLSETFSTSPLKCWTEINETWQKARCQRPLRSLCFSGRLDKQDGRPSLWLSETFSTSPLKCWTEINETWQEARSECPLRSLCFSDWSEKQDGCPGFWFAETFSTSPLKPLNGIQQNLTGSKISTSSSSSTKFVFFGPIRKN